MSEILSGLSVVELGAGSMPASIVGMLCADNGARVVKVEPPAGDRLRTQLPSGFLVWNRGKESLVADLRTARGVDEAQRWIDSADIVVDGFAPGRLSTWSLSLDALRSANPSLITCSISGFGATSAYSRIKAYDGVIAAKSGFYNRGDFGFRSGPIFSGAPLSSYGAAQMAFSGVLAALIERETSGAGQHVDATMFQGLTPTDYFLTTHFQMAMRSSGSKSAAEAAASPGGQFAASRYSMYALTKDNRWLTIALQQPQNARALISAIGLDHTYADPRFANAPVFATAEDAQSWETLLWDAAREKTWAELEATLFESIDIPFEEAVPSERALEHRQMIHNGHVVTVDDPVHGPVRQVGPIACFEKTPSRIETSAPALNAHAEPIAARAAVGGSRRPPSGGAPLAGVTIVEFGFFYAMPFGVSLAASLGARVIKLEDVNGDPIRFAFGGLPGCAKVMEGKESFAVDLKSDEGRAIVEQIIREADMFVLGFRSGVAERVGLDDASLRAINPRLVYVHSSGYGPAGPYAKRPMYAFTASATAGAFQRNAAYWMDPDLIGEFSVPELEAVVAPRVRAPADGDSNGSLAVCTSILLGLVHQKRAGEGQHLWTTMILGNAYAYSDDFNAYEGKVAGPRSDPEQFGLGALYRLYPVRDRWIFLAAPCESEWQALVLELGLSSLADDPRFADADARRQHGDALSALVGDALQHRSADEWEVALTKVGVGCAAVPEESFAAFCAGDDDLRATGLVAEVEHPVLGTIVRHGAPVRFSDAPARIASSCLYGDATAAILSELGYDGEAIEDLLDRSVVFGPDPDHKR